MSYKEETKHYLSLKNQVRCPEEYLCLKVEGFPSLWEDFVNNPSLSLGCISRTSPIQTFLSRKWGIPLEEAKPLAEEIRGYILNLLPTELTAKELKDIIENHLEEGYD